MSDIFISYKREEQPTAMRLAVALERQGWSVWWDPKLRVGEHFDDVIEKALQDAKCVIVLWSRQSVNSRYVRDEATYALNKEKLIPIAVEDVDPPFRFSGIQTAQFHEWDGSDTFPGFLRLVDDIRSIIGSPSVSTANKKQLHNVENESIQEEGSGKAKTGILSESDSSKPGTGRTNAEWISAIVAILALGLFYLGAVPDACSNKDFLLLSALIGFPLSVFLIFQKQLYRIAWIIAPLISFFVGMPYGHNYGTITKSQLFGLDQGTNCQAGSIVLIILIVVAVAAAIDHSLFLRNSKK